MVDNPDWQKVVAAYDAYIQARGEFFRNTNIEERLEILRQKLSSREWVALDIIQRMAIEQKKQFFDIFVEIASDTQEYSWANFSFELILSLPKEWLLENIERHVDPMLKNGTYDEYVSFLSLYANVDRDLTIKLAHRALEHDDPEVRKLGKDYLTK